MWKAMCGERGRERGRERETICTMVASSKERHITTFSATQRRVMISGMIRDVPETNTHENKRRRGGDKAKMTHNIQEVAKNETTPQDRDGQCSSDLKEQWF